MTEPRYEHDPESLAEQLDRLLPPDGTGTPAAMAGDSDPLVQAALRLANAPRPELSAGAMSRIQAQVLQAARQAHPAAPRFRLPRVGWPLAAAAAAVILLAAVISQGGTRTGGSPTPTLREQMVPVEDTATATPSNTPTLTATPTPSETPTLTATYTPTSTPSETPTPTATPTGTLTAEPSAGAVNATGGSSDGEVTPTEWGLIVEEDGTLNYDCNNPPPDHAPALGWREQCEGGPPPNDVSPGRSGSAPGQQDGSKSNNGSNNSSSSK